MPLTVKKQKLGFEDFTAEVEDVLKDHKKLQKVCYEIHRKKSILISDIQDREKKPNKFEQSGMTEEELQAQQEALFAASRARFEANQ